MPTRSNRQSIIDNNEVRIDLHVHSRFSSRPYSWFLRSAHSAECYTDPATVYKTAKLRGMNLVTLSDHDTIDGALELAAMGPDTFISEEVSARFPEDGCIVHTIALDISEEQHREIQRLRVNVYELVSYLHHQGVEFFLCHPLSEVNRRLQTSHLERCLLMFRNLEIRNGTRDAVHEECLRQILAGLSPAVIARYAEKHPGTPVLNPEGRYGLVGGSDDHAGLSIARASTTFTGERSGRGVTAALRERRTRACGVARHRDRARAQRVRGAGRLLRALGRDGRDQARRVAVVVERDAGALRRRAWPRRRSARRRTRPTGRRRSGTSRRTRAQPAAFARAGARE